MDGVPTTNHLDQHKGHVEHDGGLVRLLSCPPLPLLSSPPHHLDLLLLLHALELLVCPLLFGVNSVQLCVQ